MARPSRMLVLLSLLQSRRDWPGPALADRLEISERTVRRDVERLRDLGYRIQAIKGPDGGYRLDAGSELPPLLFDDEQAIALAVALQTVPVTGELAEAAARALTTVRQVMPARLRGRIDAVSVTSIPSRPSVPVDSATLLAVSAAVHATEVLRFDYADVSRRAEPHALVSRSERWYLVAWDLDRGDWRTFRVDRMTPKPPTRVRFQPREIPDVAARFKGSSGADEWPCTGSAIIALPAHHIAPYIGDGIVEELGDRTRVTVGSWSWVGLAASLLRFNADVTAVEPVELREAFGVLVRRGAAASG